MRQEKAGSEWELKKTGRVAWEEVGKRRAQIKQGLEIPDADILLEV